LQSKTFKKYRKTPNFRQAFSKPPCFSSKQFLIWQQTNNTGQYARLGVVLSKKNVKMAVVRNKYKRISRELFNRYRPRFVNQDIVLVIKNPGNINNIQDWKQRLISAYTWLEHFVGRQAK